MASIIPATTSQVVSAAAANASSTSATSSATGVDKDTLAGNFQTFLTLLTTQLKNQNPLDPLDTNQFTAAARAVRPGRAAAQVRTTSSPRWSRCRRPRSPPQRSSSSARRSRSTARPRRSQNGAATWDLTVPKPATGDRQHQERDRPDRLHRQLHDERRHASRSSGTARTRAACNGPTAITPSRSRAQDANGQPVAIPTEIQAPVDSADLTQSPPVLSIAGQDYTLDKIKRVVRNSN